MGDHYVVNGVKTWTTMAQYADWMFCLVRTSNEDIRQLGISFVLMDMNTPGISVKPIVTLDTPAGGYQEINMVYFEDVKVPKENLVGEQGEGLDVRKYLLEFERRQCLFPRVKGCDEPFAWKQLKQQLMAAVNHTLKAQNFSASLMIPRCKLPQWSTPNSEYWARWLRNKTWVQRALC